MKTLLKSILLVLLFTTFASCTNYDDDDVEQNDIENIQANGEDDNYDGSKE